MSQPDFGQFISAINGRPFPPSAVIADFIVNRYQTTDTVGKELLVTGNPDRVAWILPNNVTDNEVYYDFYDETNSGAMFTIPSLLPPQIFTFREIGPLITNPLYYNQGGFGSTHTWYEIIYRP